MSLTTDALIIRENNNIGEADRFVTTLTRDLGVIRASARGARNLKSRNASATQLLSYSRLSLIKGKAKYIIDDAQPIQIFFDLRSDIEKLALAQYFCELAGLLAPQEEPAEDYLRLMLNALYFLGSGKRSPQHVKAVLELRLLSLAGFMPDLTACCLCGQYDGTPMWFQVQAGTLRCTLCQKTQPSPDAILMGGNLLAAMRHILYTPFDKCFAFSMEEDSLEALSRCVEAFLLAQLGRSFHTLDFYHALKQP